MGYTTDFIGQFNVTPNLTEAHKNYLTAFAQSRRMKRSHDIALGLNDPYRIKADLPIGEQASYFVGTPNDNGNSYGQKEDISIIDYNRPPVGQPGLWCQWMPNEEGNAIVWDQGEKFYHYTEWIEYLLENFLTSWGYLVNGTVTWQGEDITDRGKIVVTNNIVTTQVDAEISGMPGTPSELAQWISNETDADYNEILEAIQGYIRDKQ